MNNMQNILNFLKMPEAKKIGDLNQVLATDIHKKIILKKKFLQNLYSDFYSELKQKGGPGARIIEIGSGGGFAKKEIAKLITSDIKQLSYIDLSFSACRIPFKNDSVDGLIMLNVFHHLDKPEEFLSNAQACLKPAGKLVMIEPANTLWGRFIFKNFHHELFDPSKGWDNPAKGPLSYANGALPWIFFVRDRLKFEQRFQNLKIKSIRFHSPLTYLLSGGFTLRQLLPDACYSLVKGLEKLLSPFNNSLGMFFTVEIEKVTSKSSMN